MVRQRVVKVLKSKRVGFGEQAETVFVEYVKNKLDHKIINRNFYYRFGEIDLISFDGRFLYFWEVKARHGLAYGYPEEAVTTKKIYRIEKGVEVFFEMNPDLKKYDWLIKVASLIFQGNELIELKVFDINGD